MDDLVRHCLRELSFDGDLGEQPCFFFMHVIVVSKRDAKRLAMTRLSAGSNPPEGVSFL